MNNRQNGRRRGRGGQQVRNGQPGGGAERGNRIDNRARGNAAQLLEKYKSLARDAQMQGDRVNTEYYHQFADHYFRVLSESRLRFDEQRPQQQRRDDFSPDFDGEGEQDARSDAEGQREPQAQGGWSEGEDESVRRQPMPETRGNEDRIEGERRPRRARAQADGGSRRDNGNGNARDQDAEANQADADDRIALDALPQGFATPSPGSDDGAVEEAPRPRRRAPRRPRTEANEAPAAEA